MKKKTEKIIEFSTKYKFSKTYFNETRFNFKSKRKKDEFPKRNMTFLP